MIPRLMQRPTLCIRASCWRRWVLPVIALVLWSAPLQARVLQVPQGYAKIQRAIDVASDGDEIIVSPGHYAVVRNNIIALNESQGPRGAGVYDCFGTFINNIVWSNTNNQDAVQIQGDTTPTYCCIQGWSGGGLGNINLDPLFVNAAQGDFHLKATSPCIDAAAVAPGLADDYEGRSRPLKGTSAARDDGTVYDMGAYEYPGPAAVNHPPNTPVNLTPVNGGNVQSYAPTLQASPFSDPDPLNTHLASQWQVTTDTAMNHFLITATVSSGDKTQLPIGLGSLVYGKTHYWRVRYQDQSGAWSNWSRTTWFVYPAAQAPARPVTLQPAAGSIVQTLTPTLTCTPLQNPYPPDTPAAAQWQVTDTAGFSKILFDSGVVNNTTSQQLPRWLMKLEKQYFWRVRHRNALNLWSDWSLTASFTMSDVIPSEHWGNFFPGCSGHASFVFDNKLWVVTNDSAWSSSDGKNWKFRAEFFDSYYHDKVYFPWVSVLIHKGRLWLFDQIYNKIWYSHDGTDWLQASTSPPTIQSNGSGIVSFLNKIWVIGGVHDIYNEGWVPIRINEIWASDDGYSFQQTGLTPFAGRSQHNCLVLNGRLYVIAGEKDGSIAGSTILLNDVYSTADCISWRHETAAAPFSPRRPQAGLVFNNRLWIMGAVGQANVDIWSSADGTSWTQATAAASFGPRQGFSAAAFAGRIWVIGGTGGPRNSMLNDVWSSADGVNWRKESGFTSIQDAIDAAPEGAEVVVPPGRYREQLEIDRNIKLRSQNPADPNTMESTVIDGSWWRGTNTGPFEVAVLRLSDKLGSASRVAGFTIMNGGTGILGKHSLATIEHNHFINNSGCMFQTDYGSDDNNYGGAMNDCDGLIQNNIFENNSASIGGALCGCAGTIQNNFFINNSVYDDYHDGGRMGNGYTIPGYGSALCSCAGLIRNNTIVSGDNPVFNNGDPTGENHSVIDYCGTLLNNIVWCEAQPSSPLLRSNSSVTYCLIHGWTSGGLGNFDADPRFVDRFGGNYHLRSVSPCIDAGCVAPGLALDFDGDRRGMRGTNLTRGDGSLIDIGADEFIPPNNAVSPSSWRRY